MKNKIKKTGDWSQTIVVFLILHLSGMHTSEKCFFKFLIYHRIFFLGRENY